MTAQPPTWCTCTTGGINPTCSHHAWQLPRKLAPPRMDVVPMTADRPTISYAEARRRAFQILADAEKERAAGRDHHSIFTDMADALEASEAQVARLRAQVEDLSTAWTEGWDCSATPGHDAVNEAFARVARDERPADRLAKVEAALIGLGTHIPHVGQCFKPDDCRVWHWKHVPACEDARKALEPTCPAAPAEGAA